MTRTGTYTLLIELARSTTVRVGALGEQSLREGAYAYTGSAFGSGGFSRIDRHRRLARGDHNARHWHVDYLLGHPDAAIRTVVTSEGVDVECVVAHELGPGPIEGFGSSDCACVSHLAFDSSPERLLDRVRSAHQSARD